ncbi:TonB-dependent receptor plug domain-containing protein [Alteromonas sp. NFXS44]|uniref:TonB-dependent receptor n=1 Tax=Alteromonas sp. NFXS44 TaxID=2818435 RepID=UPI0032DEC900
MRKHKITLSVAMAISSLSASNVAMAQQNEITEAENRAQIEVIEVTAEKKVSSIQETPASIVAISGEAISSQGRNDIREVLDTVAGVSFSNAAFGATNINMRGVEGATAAFGRTDPGVSINVDGVVSSSLIGDTGSLAFFDIDRLEVLRGPQGTLYGRGAIAGVLNVITKDPTDVFELSGSVERGNYDLIRATGVMNLPLNDNWAMRVAYNSVDRDSYYTSGLNDLVSSGSRIKLAYNDGGAFSALFGVENNTLGGAVGSGGRGAGSAVWGLGEPDYDAWDDVTQDGGLTGQEPGSSRDFDFAKYYADLRFSTSFADFRILPSYSKTDQLKNLIINTGTAYQYGQFPEKTEADSTTFEAQMSSPESSDIDWIIGLYYDEAERSNHSTEYDTFLFQDQSTQAVFAQTTIPFGSWAVTAGARMTKDEKSFINTSNYETESASDASGSKDWSRFDWKLGVEKELNDTSSAYMTLATGYRPGGMNTNASPIVTNLAGEEIPNKKLFSDPEYLTTLEIGSKNMLFDGTLMLNVSAYYYDYTDRQYNYFTTTADPTVDCPDGSAPRVFFDVDVVCSSMLNAEGIETTGLELESMWLVTEDSRISLSTAYTRSVVSDDSYLTFTATSGTSFPDDASSTVNLNGAQSPRTPELQVKGFYEHFFDFYGGTLSLRADVRYSSEIYVSGYSYMNPAIRESDGTPVGDLYTVDANTQFDVMATYMPGGEYDWKISAYIRNITEEVVKSTTDGSTAQAEPPRTFGIVFSANIF